MVAPCVCEVGSAGRALECAQVRRGRGPVQHRRLAPFVAHLYDADADVLTSMQVIFRFDGSRGHYRAHTSRSLCDRQTKSPFATTAIVERKRVAKPARQL